MCIRDRWTYVHNPYAGIGQEQAGWFRFSETGHMVTGWYQDGDGNSYYLNPNSDGTLGRMVTGWQLSLIHIWTSGVVL